MAGTLRERQRQLTRTSIQRATLALAQQRGLDNVTVAQIANAAGVSVRTFFNHFSTKEEALAVPEVAFDVEAEEAFVARRDVPLGEALEALAARVIEVMVEADAAVSSLAALHEAGKHDPRIASLTLQTFGEAEDRLALLVGQRLDRSADDISCRLAAVFTVGVVRVVLVDCHQRRGFTPPRSAQETLQDAFATVRTFLATRHISPP